jgi:hypothetical protein
VYNQAVYFKRTMKHSNEPMSHLESIATTAVSIKSHFNLIVMTGGL